MEQSPQGEQLPTPPEEINLPELKTDEEGKQYLYEKDGVRYGGDYLNEPPAEINLNEEPLPPAPEAPEHPAL